MKQKIMLTQIHERATVVNMIMKYSVKDVNDGMTKEGNVGV